MGKPQVTLTLAGDESKLTQAFDRVGESSRRMTDTVGQSSQRVAEDTESGFGRAGEAADGAEGKAQGFADVLTGTADIGAGTAEIMKGNLFEGFVTVGQGAADLAGGLASFLIPALSNLTKASLTNTIQTARQTAANVVAKGASLASAAATNVLAVAQRVLNAAMRANPIGIVITALTVLAGLFVLAYQRSSTFRAIVQGALNGVKTAAQTLASFFTGTLWPGIKWAWDKINSGAANAKTWVVKQIDGIVGFAKSVPGKIGGFFKGVGSAISAPFSAAFSAVKNAWNNSVGGKGFTIPGWVPELGGKDFRIPYFHTGGVVSGALGSETLAMVKAGERVTGGRNGAGGVTVVLQADGSKASRALLELLRGAIQATTGGDVQAALGR